MVKTWWDSPDWHVGNAVMSLDVDLCRWQVGVRWSSYADEWTVNVSFLCVSLFLGRWL